MDVVDCWKDLSNKMTKLVTEGEQRTICSSKAMLDFLLVCLFMHFNFRHILCTLVSF